MILDEQQETLHDKMVALFQHSSWRSMRTRTSYC